MKKSDFIAKWLPEKLWEHPAYGKDLLLARNEMYDDLSKIIEEYMLGETRPWE